MKHEKKDGGMEPFFNLKREEIGRVKITDWTSLVASIVNEERLDLRIVVDSYADKGWTLQGFRFILDGNWEEFKRLVEKIDKVYQGKPEPALSGILDGGGSTRKASKQTNIANRQDITIFQNSRE